MNGSVRVGTRQAITRSILSGLLLLVVGLFPAGCQKHGVPSHGLNLAMGNPSNATRSSSNPDNYLIANDYFALSYNNSKGAPNWVSWRLAESDIGDAGRVPFYPDPDLPSGFQVVRPADYTGSGFDRGHRCPHGDRSADDTMSKSTFVLTNIVPQSPPLNEQTWEELESYCRDLAEQGKVLYIVDGPYGKGGTGRNGFLETIGTTNTITVPSKCWMVIMVVYGGPGDDLSRVTRDTRLIAVIMPNNMKVRQNWAGYRTSVARVEKLTGYKFFDKVPADIIGPLKKRVDKVAVPAAAPPRYGRQTAY
jgi:endonuclease G